MVAAQNLLLIAMLVSPVTLLAMESRANPIRKVVNMLTMMQAKVTEEGAKEKVLYEKFMCYCQNNLGSLAKAVEDAKARLPDIESSIEEGVGKQAQLQKDLADHKADRVAAKKAMAEAEAIREKDNKSFEAEYADDKTNVAAMDKAIAALSAGMGSGFVQTETAATLKKLVLNRKDNMAEADAQELLSFLSSTDGSAYDPQSGEITGILKQMRDEFAESMAQAKAQEADAVKEFEDMVAAKTKEVAALTKMIEQKLQRTGEIAVEVENAKNDHGDTAEALAGDEKFLAQLETGCKTKTGEYDARQKTRSEELVALADTVKLLNDDDALELFKKTLPSAAASFMQVQVTTSEMRARALEALRGSKRPAAGLDFIALALRGSKVGFEKVIQMVDDLIGVLQSEQKDDDTKKTYCGAELDKSDDKKKALERGVSDTQTAIAKTKEDIAATADEIAATANGIKALDQSVAEATAQRKAEHSDFEELMAGNGAAKELLRFAINRLRKFYDPKMYKAPPKRELSEEDRITVNMGGELAPTSPPGGIAGTGIEAASFVQVRAHMQMTFGARRGAKQESSGVIEMINILIRDLDKDMTLAKAEEKDGQADYEKAMEDAAAKRAQDSKALAAKEAATADAAASLDELKATKKSNAKELGATNQYIMTLHQECDFLLQYFDVRREARASEIDSLTKAKAVLSGADYSFLQVATTKSHRFLA